MLWIVVGGPPAVIIRPPLGVIGMHMAERFL